MIKKIRVMTTIYTNISLSAKEAKKVRGFFADLDQLDSNLHNHMVDGKEIYRYPLIQYKVLGGNPVIIAAEEGIRSIHPHIMEQKALRIGDKTYTDMTVDMRLLELPLGDSKSMKSYRFLTPWLALNQRNYEEYHSADEEKKKQILSKVLVGNILSICKGFGVTIEQRLQVEHQLTPVTVDYKGKKMVAFVGKFQVNCCIPELFGIGKGTARGFGTVKIEK
jgi:hypothetical protein